MLTPNDAWQVQIERSRGTLRVTAAACGGAPRVEITFSAGADGTWFRVIEAQQARSFAREQIASHQPLAAILRLIGDEVDLVKSPSQQLLGLLFQSLLVYVSRLSQAVPRPRWGRPLRDKRIERALALLEQDLSKYWTVELLARAVGLSRPVFAREFVRALQLSPMRYLAHRRMQRAADLLRSSDQSLGDVASQVGYRSEFAFGRAFKQHFHVAPGTYRRLALPATGALCLAA
ncbi:MAG TPA: AraC family transcriptional regulator [Polyangiaceae bacterium]|nr:AraC family transcriptional regulator [Polyangiaceae bacterium]